MGKNNIKNNSLIFYKYNKVKSIIYIISLRNMPHYTCWNIEKYLPYLCLQAFWEGGLITVVWHLGGFILILSTSWTWWTERGKNDRAWGEVFGLWFSISLSLLLLLYTIQPTSLGSALLTSTSALEDERKKYCNSLPTFVS